MKSNFSEGVDKWKNKIGLLRDEIRQELVTKQLSEYLPPASEKTTVLDVGCGQGTQAIKLAQSGFQVVGIDPSEELLKIAKESSSQKGLKNLKFFKGTLEDLPKEVGTDFDVVCCHGVLMYLPDLNESISQLLRLTRPGGIISTLTRNRFDIAMRAGMSRDWQGAIEGFDKRYYNNRVGVSNVRADEPQEVIDALEASGSKLLNWFGVRLFTDHFEDESVPDNFDLILKAEEEAGRRDPYRQLTSLTHVISRKT
ncbi:MAG: class I SAM-dependent methyltransferase [Candidatus Saccharimonadales bacterium]